MQNAILDSARFGWTRFDWDNYNEKDKEYGKKLLDTAINSNLEDLKAVLEEGLGYYHFPDNISLLTRLQEEKPATYFFLMSNRSNFYNFDSIY